MTESTRHAARRTWLRTRQAAEELGGCSVAHVRALVKLGDLKALNVAKSTAKRADYRFAPPARDQTRFTFFTPEQARVVLEYAKGTPRAALLGTALYAGLRRLELGHLRTGIDVDLAADVIHVQSRGGDHPWKPKTKHGERKVPIIPALRRLLVAHLDAGYAGERYFFRGEMADAPPSGSTMDRWTEEAYGWAGVRYGRSHDALALHSCRHSFATWLLEHGVPVTTVARWMGDTVPVLLQVYAHHLPDRDKEAAKLLQELAGGGR